MEIWFLLILYSVRKKKQVEVRIFDDKNKIVKEFKAEEWASPTWKLEDYVIQRIGRFGDDIHVILAHKVDGKNIFYKNTLTKDYKAGNKLERLGEYAVEKKRIIFRPFLLLFGEGFAKVGDDNNLQYVASPDESKHLFYHFNQDKERPLVELFCYDSNFQKIYSASHSIPIEKNIEFDYKTALITNNGDVYFNYYNDLKKKQNGSKRQFFLAKVTDNGRNFYKTEFDKKKEHIRIRRGCVLSTDQNSLYQSSVLYTPDKKKEFIGYGMSQYDMRSNKFADQKIAKVDLTLLRKIYKNRRAEKIFKKNIDLSNYLRHVGFYSFSDDSKLLILEEQEARYHQSQKTSQSWYTYLFGNIVLIKFNPNNEYAWSKVIYRKQGFYHERLLPYLGTMSFKLGENVCLIYNDNEKNLRIQGQSGSGSKEDVSSRGAFKKLDAIMRIVKPNGEVVSKTILKGKNEDEVMYTDDYIKIDRNSLMVSASWKKKKKYGLLSIATNSKPSKEAIVDRAQVEGDIESDSSQDSEAVLSEYQNDRSDNSSMNTKTENDHQSEDALSEITNSSPRDTFSDLLLTDNPSDDLLTQDSLDYHTVLLIYSDEKITQHPYLNKFRDIYEKIENNKYYYYIGRFKSKAIAERFIRYLNRQYIQGLYYHMVNNQRVLENY